MCQLEVSNKEKGIACEKWIKRYILILSQTMINRKCIGYHYEHEYLRYIFFISLRVCLSIFGLLKNLEDLINACNHYILSPQFIARCKFFYL